MLIERERRRRKAAAAQTAQIADPIMPAVRFRGAALRLQSMAAPEIMLSGPSETGKTVASLYKAHRLCLTHRGLQGAFIRKVRHDMDGTVLQIFKDVFLKGSDVRIYGGERVEFYEYPSTGSRIWVGGMDRPGATLSAARDFVYVNQAEELLLGDWETLSTRTTGRAGVLQPGILFGDCNPGPAHHWIKQRAGLEILESRHEDNPSLFDDDGQITKQGVLSLATLDKLTGVRKERLRFGRWVNAEGAVYEFDPAVHLLDYNSDRFPYSEIPKSWRRIRAIDFGFTNPFVCQWWAVDPDGRMYLYREIYMTQRTVRAHAVRIKFLENWMLEDGKPNPQREHIVSTTADHDAEDRATLSENGISSNPAKKEISVGIQKVQERLALAGDGKPRLYVMRGALVERDESLAAVHKPISTEQEFGVYVWPKSSDGRPVKEVPVDENNHGMDAARYAVMYLDGRGGSLVGW